MNVTFTIHGGEIKEQFDSAMKKALTECGLEAQKYAKYACPVDTGLLRNSIAYAKGGEGATPSTYKSNTDDKSGEYSGLAPEDADGVYSVYIGTNVEYASHVEYGTSTQKAQPYLEPAVADHTDVYQRIIKSELGGE